MSSTTTTQFYGLTQYIGTDKPDFADNNQAFRNVDADLHQVVQDSQGFTSDIADLTERVGNLNTDLTNLSGDLDGEKAKITALQNKELSQDTEISRVERNAQDMITAYNEASATSTHAYAVGDYFIYNNVLYQATAAIAVGATIVPDTNCTTTNVASELIQLNSDLAALSPYIADTTRRVTADGVKNYKQLLEELYADAFADLANKSTYKKKNAFIELNDSVYRLDYISSSVAEFTTTSQTVDHTRTSSIFLGSNNSRFFNADIAVSDSQVTFTDFSGTVPASGLQINLYY